MKNIAVLIFLVLITSSAYSAEDNPGVNKPTKSAWDDLRQRLALDRFGKTAEGKLYETLKEEPDYFHEATIQYLQHALEPRPYLLSDRELNLGADQIRDDVVNSARYALEKEVRDLVLFKLLRQWFLGLLSVQIDQPRHNEVIFEPVSISRPVDSYEDRRYSLNFECDHIVGHSAVALQRRIECFNKEVEIKKEEDKAYKFRVHPGLDVSGNFRSNLFIEPSFEPYVEVKLPKVDAKLSYSVPILIYGTQRVGVIHFLNNFESLIPDDHTKERDRLRLSLERYLVTDYFNLDGSYQFERQTNRHFVSVNPQYTNYPYRASASLMMEITRTKPQIGFSLERALGKNWIMGFGSSVLEPNNKVIHQIGATIQAIW